MASTMCLRYASDVARVHEQRVPGMKSTQSSCFMQSRKSFRSHAGIFGKGELGFIPSARVALSRARASTAAVDEPSLTLLKIPDHYPV